MALGKKTGGRDFLPDNSGKPKGAKDKIPRGARKTVKEMLGNIMERSGAHVEVAIEKKLLRADKDMTKLLAEYVDGKPVTRVQVHEPQPLNIVIQQGGRCAECGSTQILEPAAEGQETALGDTQAFVSVRPRA